MECQKYTCVYTLVKGLSLTAAAFSMFQVSEVALPCCIPHQEVCGSALKIFSVAWNIVQIKWCMVMWAAGKPTYQ